MRSTFGTSTELLNVLLVMFSRLGSHLCPNGHRLAPTIDAAANKVLVCRSTTPLRTVHALDPTFPKGRLTAVTGMSGSGDFGEEFDFGLDLILDALSNSLTDHDRVVMS